MIHWLLKIIYKFRRAKPGDLVVCKIDSDWNDSKHSIGLEHGKIYRVKAIVTCRECRCTAYDIGSRFENKELYTTCSYGHRFPAKGKHLAGLRRFEVLSPMSKEYLNFSINEAINIENYEEAHKHHQTLKKIHKS